jgi:hypothetical protein
MGVSCFELGVPPLRGVLLSFASPKESKQRKGDPGSVPAAPIPCATRFGRGLRNSGLKPLKQCSPFSRPTLRCSAPLKGPGKPSGVERCAATIGIGANLVFAPFGPSTATGQYLARQLRRDAFRPPLRGAEQRRRAGGSRLALSEPQASSGKPPGPTSSARNRACPAPTQGSPFLWLLSFGEAKESTPASRAEAQANRSRSPGKPAESPAC